MFESEAEGFVHLKKKTPKLFAWTGNIRNPEMDLV